jgi:hypothetical protein
VKNGFLTLLLAALCTGALALDAAADPARIAIVVGQNSPTRTVTEDDLRELYLKRRRLWPDGRPAVPVNLPADDALRIDFSRRVLGRAPDQLVAHWNRQYFDGITPPVVLRSSAAVCKYVAADPDAIGYLAENDVAPGCRVILVLGH